MRGWKICRGRRVSCCSYQYGQAALLLAGIVSSCCHVALSMTMPDFTSRGRAPPLGMPAHPSQRAQQSDAPAVPATESCRMSATCACGESSVDFLYQRSTNPEQDSRVVDCHCSSCRRYHVAAFVRYLDLQENDVMVSGDSIVRFEDSCSAMGRVERTYCRICSSKLLTTAEVSPGKFKMLVNMGAIREDTIPDDVADTWYATEPVPWSQNMEASWTKALPAFHDERQQQQQNSKNKAIVATGGCTCGSCQYEFIYEAPSEMQHCYCSLCRHLSGGPFMTWVPVLTQSQEFRWIREATVTKVNTLAQRASVPDRPMQPKWSSGQVPLVRYTDIGERHICSKCGGVLSIQYDYENTGDEHDTIWLAAGAFDSIRFPFKIEPYLERVVHISCVFKPDWYALPDDGMPRIDDAS